MSCITEMKLARVGALTLNSCSRFFGDLVLMLYDYTQFSSKYAKLIPTQGFCEYICNLIACIHKFQAYIIAKNMISNEMISDLSILCFLVLDRVFSQINSTCSITLTWDIIILKTIIL